MERYMKKIKYLVDNYSDNLTKGDYENFIRIIFNEGDCWGILKEIAIEFDIIGNDIDFEEIEV